MSLTPLASASCCAGVNDQGRARELLAEALRVAACSITNPRGQDSALESVVRVLSEQDPVTAELARTVTDPYSQARLLCDVAKASAT